MSKQRDGIETRKVMLAWDKLIGSLLTGWAVPGIEMARARFRLLCGTAGTSSVDAKGEGQVHKHEAQSTEAMHEGRIDP